jgi:Aldehyde dehydrogenase family
VRQAVGRADLDARHPRLLLLHGTKPSEFTPFAPDLYGRLLRQAGVPAGVCSILAGGPEAGAALVRNPTVEKVSFTGGPAAARQIAHVCAEQLKPAVLELGKAAGPASASSCATRPSRLSSRSEREPVTRWG